MEAQPNGGPDQTGADQAGFDLLDLDLETLRTVEHPVLSALVEDLKERIAAPGGEALWGFDNSM